MKPTVEIADALPEEVLGSVLDARRTAAQPFRLRDGSFRGGNGLQPGVKWEDLAALAYEISPEVPSGADPENDRS